MLFLRQLYLLFIDPSKYIFSQTTSNVTIDQYAQKQPKFTKLPVGCLNLERRQGPTIIFCLSMSVIWGSEYTIGSGDT